MASITYGTQFLFGNIDPESISKSDGWRIETSEKEFVKAFDANGNRYLIRERDGSHYAFEQTVALNHKYLKDGMTYTQMGACLNMQTGESLGINKIKKTWPK